MKKKKNAGYLQKARIRKVKMTILFTVMTSSLMENRFTSLLRPPIFVPENRSYIFL